MATDPDTGITYKRQRTGPLFAGYFNKIGLPGVKAQDENGNPLPDNPWEREQIRFDGDASQLYWPPDMFIIENSILYLRTKNEDGSYSRRRIGLIDQNLDEVIRTGDNAELNGLDVTGPIDFQTDQIAIGNPNGSNRHTGLPQIITNLQNGLGNIDLSDVVRTGDDARLSLLRIRERWDDYDGVSRVKFLDAIARNSSGFDQLKTVMQNLSNADNQYDYGAFMFDLYTEYIDFDQTPGRRISFKLIPRENIMDYNSAGNTTHKFGAGTLQLDAGTTDNPGTANLNTDSVNIGDPDGDNRHEGLAQIITDLQNQVSTLQNQANTFQTRLEKPWSEAKLVYRMAYWLVEHNNTANPPMFLTDGFNATFDYSGTASRPDSTWSLRRLNKFDYRISVPNLLYQSGKPTADVYKYSVTVRPVMSQSGSVIPALDYAIDHNTDSYYLDINLRYADSDAAMSYDNIAFQVWLDFID